MQPKYPIYIISKGRADSRLTSKTLDEIRVPYKIVIEESEFDDYNKGISADKILTLPPGFRENPKYAIPDNKGRIGGSIPARNFVWDHSIKEGHERHWIMDDNIKHFYRLHKNQKTKVTSGTVIRLCEDFTDRYKNVKMSGMNYQYFAPASQKKRPYTLNTRIYSCILLSNDIKHRWRGKYNEDTDLSLNILKDDWCTILFNAFLCGKITTLVMGGGNTDNVYVDGDNRLQFAQALVEQHPDLVKVVQRYNRWHHHVDYSPFKKNKLTYRDDYVVKGGTNEYGMKLHALTMDQYKKATTEFGNAENPYYEQT